MSDSILELNKDQNVRFSLKNFDDFFTISVKENVNVSITLDDFKATEKLVLKAGKNSTIKLVFFIENDKKSLDLQAFLEENAILRVYFSDYTNGNSEIKSVVNLNGINSRSEFLFTTLGEGTQKKKYDISFNHNNSFTYSDFESYGVSTENSFLSINGVSHIYEKCIKCETHQKSKVILFDKESRAIANPILKIDNDDVIASHSCAIGSLNSDHIFYLLSRGLSEKEAKKLITFGYLLPICEHFDDETAAKIKKYVEEDFND